MEAEWDSLHLGRRDSREEGLLKWKLGIQRLEVDKCWLEGLGLRWLLDIHLVEEPDLL